jgi:hypothetical protein
MPIISGDLQQTMIVIVLMTTHNAAFYAAYAFVKLQLTLQPISEITQIIIDTVIKGNYSFVLFLLSKKP